MPGWALGLILNTLVSGIILVIGLRRDSVVLIVMGGAWFLLPAGFAAIILTTFAVPAFTTASVSRVLGMWYVLVGGIWALLAFFGFKHLDTGKGKALVVFAILWSFVLPMPLVGICRWQTGNAFLTTFGLTALGYIIIGVILKSAKAAKARKETLYKLLLEKVDTEGKPPWES